MPTRARACVYKFLQPYYILHPWLMGKSSQLIYLIIRRSANGHGGVYNTPFRMCLAYVHSRLRNNNK